MFNTKYQYNTKQTPSAHNCPSLPTNFYLKHQVLLESKEVPPPIFNNLLFNYSWHGKSVFWNNSDQIPWQPSQLCIISYSRRKYLHCVFGVQTKTPSILPPLPELPGLCTRSSCHLNAPTPCLPQALRPSTEQALHTHAQQANLELSQRVHFKMKMLGPERGSDWPNVTQPGLGTSFRAPNSVRLSS